MPKAPCVATLDDWRVLGWLGRRRSSRCRRGWRRAALGSFSSHLLGLLWKLLRRITDP